MKQVILSLKQLKAALVTAGNKDVRYYLNAIYVEVEADFIRVVSTDGSHLSVFHNVIESGSEPFNVIIPRSVIEDLPKSTGEQVTLVQDPDVFTWSLGVIPFTPLEARYPEYRRILVQKPSGQAAHIPVDVGVKLRKLADTATKRGASVRIWQNGEGGAGVTIHGVPEYFGIIMPLRNDYVEKHLSGYPTWLNR